MTARRGPYRTQFITAWQKNVTLRGGANNPAPKEVGANKKLCGVSRQENMGAVKGGTHKMKQMTPERCTLHKRSERKVQGRGLCRAPLRQRSGREQMDA